MAEKDGKLYIIITDDPIVNKTETTTVKESKSVTKEIQKAADKKDRETYTFATHQFYHFIQQTATEMVNWSVGNIGNFTGEYVKQANIQKVISLSNRLVGIGSAIAVGAHFGPIGALVTGTVAVVGTGINIALQDKANEFQVQKQNREIAQLRELSGLNPLTNGGRI